MNQQEQIPFDSNPFGLDKFFVSLKGFLEELQLDCKEGDVVVDTQNLFDIDTIFLAAKRYSDGDIFVREVYPIAKNTGGDSRDLRPNESFKSTAFLYEHSPRIIGDGSGEDICDLSLVVSYQQQLLMPFLGYQIPEKLQAACISVLRNTQIGGEELQLYTDREMVFTDFDIKYFKEIFTNQFNHFRIRFKASIDKDCIPFGTNVTFDKTNGNRCN